MSDEKREISHKGFLAFSIVVILGLLVPFILYLTGTITKLTMSLLFLIPVALLGAAYAFLKVKKKM